MTKQSIAKIKQIFHSYLPLIFIFLFPKSFSGVFLAFGYIAFSGYFYFDKIFKNYPEETYEYYLFNVSIVSILIALHVNAL